MNKLLIISFIVLACTHFGQTIPRLALPLIISDQVDPHITISFGIDPTATDSTDTWLGEANLPPFPPTGVFEARFIMPFDSFSGVVASYRDYRNAFFPFSGEKIYRIKYQPGSGSTIKISWNFPSNITGRLQDVILGSLIDVTMIGADSFIVNDPIAFDQLKMTIFYNNVTNIIDEPILPLSVQLSQNFPNPFNPTTSLEFSLDKSAFVSITLYDVLGNMVKVLTSKEYPEGKHVIRLDATGIESGTYFYMLHTGRISLTRKMMLIK